MADAGDEAGSTSPELDHFFFILVCPQDGEILMPVFSTSGLPLFPSLTAKKDVSWKAVALQLLKKVTRSICHVTAKLSHLSSDIKTGFSGES